MAKCTFKHAQGYFEGKIGSIYLQESGQANDALASDQ